MVAVVRVAIVTRRTAVLRVTVVAAALRKLLIVSFVTHTMLGNLAP